MKHLFAGAGLVVAGWALPVQAQQTTPTTDPDIAAIIAKEIANGAPTETSGIENTQLLGEIPLARYFEGMDGASLRARMVVMDPGAKIYVHAHDKRPVFVYVLEGEIVEHRSDSDEPVIRRAGDSYFEADGLVHWSENVSGKPARILATDIVPPDTD